jgi:hypothetical protein
VVPLRGKCNTNSRNIKNEAYVNSKATNKRITYMDDLNDKLNEILNEVRTICELLKEKYAPSQIENVSKYGTGDDIEKVLRKNVPDFDNNSKKL